MTFLASPLRLSRDDMVRYILAIPKTGFKPNPNTGRIWEPKGITWHNTGAPSLGQWNTYSESQKTNWGANLNNYYRGMGWHSGPQFCGTPEDWSLVLCDPLADGIHCTCTNETDFGVETVLNAVEGGDDPKGGQGLASMQASANIIAALCARFEWEPTKAINFHRQCTADHHACPGARVEAAWAIGLVESRLAEIKAPAASVSTETAKTTTATPVPSTHAPVTSTAPSPIALPVWPSDEADPFFANAREVYKAWLAHGVSIPFALAMVTQAEFESAFRTDVVGDKGAARNMYQWHSPRIEAILAGTGIDVRTETDRTKVVSAAWWELSNTMAKARDAIAAAKTARDASIAACTLFEGAGAPEAAERRGAGAERWSVWFSEHP